MQKVEVLHVLLFKKYFQLNLLHIANFIGNREEVNLFHATDLFIYPLRILEKHSFSDVFRRV